jgi:hypothetical protein
MVLSPYVNYSTQLQWTESGFIYSEQWIVLIIAGSKRIQQILEN